MQVYRCRHVDVDVAMKVPKLTVGMNVGRYLGQHTEIDADILTLRMTEEEPS